MENLFAYALIFDDTKNEFLELAVDCASINCCQSTPKQKAWLQDLSKKELERLL